MIPSDGGGNMMGGDTGGLAPAMQGGYADGGSTTEGFGSRVGNSLLQCCCSIFVVIPLLTVGIYQNELNLVISDATAALVQKAHIVEGCSPINDDNGHLVYTSCGVKCPDIAATLPPPLSPFIPTFEGTELSWSVEIFQYHEIEHSESHKNNDGSKTTHYWYTVEAGWSSSAKGCCAHVSGYSNSGTSLPSNLRDGSVQSPDHSVFLLNGDLQATYSLPQKLAQMFPSSSVGFDTSAAAAGTSVWSGFGELDYTMLHSSGGYLTTYSGSPKIGDLRVSVSGKTGTKASVAAKQVSSSTPPFTFTDYPPQKFDFWGRKTYPLARLEPHTETKGKFIKEWQSENKMTTIIIRIVLLILMCVACNCFFAPLSTMADLTRVLNYCTCGFGSLLDNATQCMIGMVSCSCSLLVFGIVFAISWFLVRPTLSLIILIVGVVAFVGGMYIFKSQGKKEPAKAREADGYVKIDDAPRIMISGRKVQPIAQVV